MNKESTTNRFRELPTDTINKFLAKLDSFDYECSEEEFDLVLDDSYDNHVIANITFRPSQILKVLDLIAYQRFKSDYEASVSLSIKKRLGRELKELHDHAAKLQEDLATRRDEVNHPSP